MKIKIKKVKKEDASSSYSYFRDWVLQLFPDYKESLRKKMLEKVYNEKYISEQIAKNGIVLMAVSENKPVGILITDPPLGGISFGIWLMVDSKLQKHGVGKSLLKKWEEEALEQGCHSLKLEADIRNVEYYKKRGFEIIGLEKKGYFGTDNYLFHKIIAEPKEENMFK